MPELSSPIDSPPSSPVVPDPSGGGAPPPPQPSSDSQACPDKGKEHKDKRCEINRRYRERKRAKKEEERARLVAEMFAIKEPETAEEVPPFLEQTNIKCVFRYDGKVTVVPNSKKIPCRPLSPEAVDLIIGYFTDKKRELNDQPRAKKASLTPAERKRLQRAKHRQDSSSPVVADPPGEGAPPPSEPLSSDSQECPGPNESKKRKRNPPKNPEAANATKSEYNKQKRQKRRAENEQRWAELVAAMPVIKEPETAEEVPLFLEQTNIKCVFRYNGEVTVVPNNKKTPCQTLTPAAVDTIIGYFAAKKKELNAQLRAEKASLAPAKNKTTNSFQRRFAAAREANDTAMIEKLREQMRAKAQKDKEMLLLNPEKLRQRAKHHQEYQQRVYNKIKESPDRTLLVVTTAMANKRNLEYQRRAQRRAQQTAGADGAPPAP